MKYCIFVIFTFVLFFIHNNAIPVPLTGVIEINVKTKIKAKQTKLTVDMLPPTIINIDNYTTNSNDDNLKEWLKAHNATDEWIKINTQEIEQIEKQMGMISNVWIFKIENKVGTKLIIEYIFMYVYKNEDIKLNIECDYGYFECDYGYFEQIIPPVYFQYKRDKTPRKYFGLFGSRKPIYDFKLRGLDENEVNLVRNHIRNVLNF